MRTLIIALSFALAPVGAFAFVTGEPNTNGPCSADASKYCSGLKWRSGLGECLLQNRSKLSDSCQSRLREVRKHKRGHFDQCRGDIKAYCQKVQPGQGRIVQCLRQNRNALSSQCRDQLDLK